MSSFERRQALFGLFLLAGCGFRPVYGPDGAGTALQGQVAATDPVDRNGFLFVQQLERRLGASTAPRYALGYTLGVTAEGLGISTTATTTRYQLVGRADYTLTDTATGATLTSGSVEGVTGYSATSTTLANDAAATDAAERLMTILADKVVTRLYGLAI